MELLTVLSFTTATREFAGISMTYGLLIHKYIYGDMVE